LCLKGCLLEKKYTFENTLVALFDIQSYSALIDSSIDRETLINKTRGLCELAQSVASNKTGIFKTRYWILSDTIVIAIDTSENPVTFGGANVFLNICSFLLSRSLIEFSLPLRGAIGSGYLYFESGNSKNEFGSCSILLGTALVDAAKYEKMQDWLGAIITPNARKILNTIYKKEGDPSILESSDMKNVCRRGKIPLKENTFLTDEYYILPFLLSPEKFEWKSFLPPHFFRNTDKIKHTDLLYEEAFSHYK